jgi:putative polyketide hydroxylase
MIQATETDVLIVGGGPVGLSMALALRHLGVDCIVVEKHGGPMNFPRGRGVTVRTMELMRRWGVSTALREVGLPPSEVAIFVGDNLLAPTFERFVRPDPGPTATSPETSLVCFQNLTEAVLRDAAMVAGAAIRYSWELIDVVDRDGAVTADVIDRNADAKRTLKARWMVAADGAHSAIRSKLGIDRHGPGVVTHAVSIVIDAELRERTADRPSVLYRLGDLPGGTLATMDNDRRQWGLIYEYDPSVHPQDFFTDDELRRLAQVAIGDPLVEVTIVSHRFWESTALVADRFRQGKIFLVGDAAHVTTPIGGLGMNCGIGDVDNLSWKRAAVSAGWAGDSLLDTYDQERRPVAELTVDASLGRARPPAPVDGLVLGASYTSAVVHPDGTPSPQCDDPLGDYVPTGRPGHRAPHLWLDDAHTISTLDLFGDGFVLLTRSRTDAWHTVEQDLAGIPLRRIEINNPEWADLYGIEPLGAVLVRPDGFVAWRSPVPPDNAVESLRLFLQTLL